MSRKRAVRLDYAGLGQEGLVERRPDSEFIMICSRYHKMLLCWLHSPKDLPQELCIRGNLELGAQFSGSVLEIFGGPKLEF